MHKCGVVTCDCKLMLVSPWFPTTYPLLSSWKNEGLYCLLSSTERKQQGLASNTIISTGFSEFLVVIWVAGKWSTVKCRAGCVVLPPFFFYCQSVDARLPVTLNQIDRHKLDTRFLCNANQARCWQDSEATACCMQPSRAEPTRVNKSMNWNFTLLEPVCTWLSSTSLNIQKINHMLNWNFCLLEPVCTWLQPFAFLGNPDGERRWLQTFCGTRDANGWFWVE
jgi:hypothetical protein